MKISVIVPVYNAEAYLDRCIGSVIDQTYTDWELILVNDGSFDSSSEIIERYEENDERITVINQKNSGAGIARNNGINNCSGEYIVFLDSDDYLDCDYLKLLSEMVDDYDVVYIDALQITDDGNIICYEKMSQYQNMTKDEIVRSQLTGKMPWAGWRKAVKKSLLIENRIYYTNHKNGEEALYSFKLNNAAKRIGFISEKPIYYYVNRDNSLSKIRISDPWGDVVDTIKEYLIDGGLYEEYANTLNALNVAATVVSIDRISQMYTGNRMRSEAKLRLNKFKNVHDNNKTIDKQNLTFKAKIFIPFLKLNMYIPIVVCSRVRRLRNKFV